MTLTLLVSIGTIILIGLMLLLLSKTYKVNARNKPYALSQMAFGLILANWMLFLAGFYAKMPGQVTDLIFLPVWFLLCILSAAATLGEFNNNVFMAMLNGVLSILGLATGFILLIIGSM